MPLILHTYMLRDSHICVLITNIYVYAQTIHVRKKPTYMRPKEHKRATWNIYDILVRTYMCETYINMLK